MTKQEWDRCCDPLPMLSSLSGAVSPRKFRLFVLACCAEVRDLIDLMEEHRIGYGLLAIELAERMLEGRATAADVAATIIDSVGIVDSGSGPFGHLLFGVLPALKGEDVGLAAATAAIGAAAARDRYVRHQAALRRGESPSLPSEESRAEGRVAQRQAFANLCVALRDIVNPFHAVALDAAWRTSAVLTLAEGIHRDRAFERLPVLADALEEAGCSDEEVLSHCRGPGPHVRGCWVVDLLLGRE